MKYFKIKFEWLLIVLSTTNFLGVHAQQSSRQKTREFLNRSMAGEHIPGVAFAVIRNGKIIDEGEIGKANLSWDSNVDKETLFQTASCSKIYCSLLLGKLFEKKLLSPEQSLGELLDSIPYYMKPITLQQLASHQSGIAYADLDKHHFFEQLKKTEMSYEPGARSFYVSADYWILVYLLEKKFKMPYFEILKTYVLDPLQMKHTLVNNNDDNGIRIHDVLLKEAAVYAYANHTYRVSDMQFGSSGYAAGGIYTSIIDLAKVAQVLDTGRFLQPATKRRLLNNVLLKNGEKGQFAIGFESSIYQGHKISGHSGGPGLADYVRFDDEKLTVIVLTNQRGFYPHLAKTIATYYIDNLADPELPLGYQLQQ